MTITLERDVVMLTIRLRIRQHPIIHPKVETLHVSMQGFLFQEQAKLA